METRSACLSRWVALLWGCVAVGMSGALLAFNSYSNDLKKTFNMTQITVEVTASVGNLGACMGLPAGLFLEHFGSTKAYILAATVGATSNVLFWTATYAKDFYSSNAWLFVVYAFFYGFSAVQMYLGPMLTNMTNFSGAHRGKVLGFLGACWWAGPAALSAIYGLAFKDDANIGGFFLMGAILFIVINVMSIFLIKTYPSSGQMTEISYLVNTDDLSRESVEDEQTVEDEPTLMELLKSANTHLISWMFIITASIQLVYLTNLTTFTKSLHYSNLDTPLTISLPIIAAVMKFSAAALSDESLPHVPRSAYLAVGNILQTIFILLSIKEYTSGQTVFVITSVIIYITNGMHFSIIPVLFSEYFGLKHFARNWGAALLGFALVSWIFLALFGLAYELAKPDGENKCYGYHCFSSILTLLGCMSAVVVGLNIILVYKEYNYRKNKLS